MNYDTELWNKYTDDNESAVRVEVSKFIYYFLVALGAKRTLEVGCNVGNNFYYFPRDFNAYGIEINQHAVDIARKKYPFNIYCGPINKLPFPDSHFDVVYTRGVMIHIQKEGVDDILKEMLRVSKKWIFNMEYFGEDGKMIKWKRGDNLLWYRNMKERWTRFDVELVSDTEIPLEIDDGKMRFTLVMKK